MESYALPQVTAIQDDEEPQEWPRPSSSGMHAHGGCSCCAEPQQLELKHLLE